METRKHRCIPKKNQNGKEDPVSVRHELSLQKRDCR